MNIHASRARVARAIATVIFFFIQNMTDHDRVGVAKKKIKALQVFEDLSSSNFETQSEKLEFNSGNLYEN